VPKGRFGRRFDRQVGSLLRDVAICQVTRRF
jgi:hypothetical protein